MTTDEDNDTNYYEDIYAKFETSPDFNRIFNVTQYYLLDVKVYLPVHGCTFLFMCTILTSLVRNRYLQNRPKNLFILSASFFTLASAYTVAVDVSYLMMVNNRYSVQQCSTIRNLVINPIATQGFADALDRVCIIFDKATISIKRLVTLYIIFPSIAILLAVYNTFINTEWIKFDEVCLIARRTSWNMDLMNVIQWSLTIAAITMYICIWRKLSAHAQKMRKTTVMTNERYYRDKSVVRLFLISGAVPIILLIPSLVTTAVASPATFNAHNKIVSLISWVMLDFSIPFIWIVYIMFLPQIRYGVRDIFCMNPTVKDVSVSITSASADPNSGQPRPQP